MASVHVNRYPECSGCGCLCWCAQRLAELALSLPTAVVAAAVLWFHQGLDCQHTVATAGPLYEESMRKPDPKGPIFKVMSWNVAGLRGVLKKVHAQRSHSTHTALGPGHPQASLSSIIPFQLCGFVGDWQLQLAHPSPHHDG